MLEVQKGYEAETQRRQRSFSDIAVLCRTHRQFRILEKCLAKEGIPYVTVGREDFLLDPAVRGTVSFFKSLTEENTQARNLALKLLWGLEDTEMADSVYQEAKKKYLPSVEERKTGKDPQLLAGRHEPEEKPGYGQALPDGPFLFNYERIPSEAVPGRRRRSGPPSSEKLQRRSRFSDDPSWF